MNLEEKLAALPHTADEIAEFLESGGYRGLRHSPFSCPLANYFETNVTENYVRVKDEQGRSTDDKVTLPAYVSEFVRKFDNEEYPQLMV